MDSLAVRMKEYRKVSAYNLRYQGLRGSKRHGLQSHRARHLIIIMMIWVKMVIDLFCRHTYHVSSPWRLSMNLLYFFISGLMNFQRNCVGVCLIFFFIQALQTPRTLIKNIFILLCSQLNLKYWHGLGEKECPRSSLIQLVEYERGTTIFFSFLSANELLIFMMY